MRQRIGIRSTHDRSDWTYFLHGLSAQKAMIKPRRLGDFINDNQPQWNYRINPYSIPKNFIRERSLGRKLKANWTIEFADDIIAYNAAGEDELTAILSEEISKEIDAEIVGNLTQHSNFIYVPPTDPFVKQGGIWTTRQP